MGKREKMTEERKTSDSQCCATRRKNAPELCPPRPPKKKKKKPYHIKHLSFQKFMMTLYRAVFHRSSEDLFMATLNFFPVGK